ncbi:hypothetical protein Tco_1269614, partial [Tanacetum coccineum]
SMMSGSGGGWLAKRSIDSNSGTVGVLVDLGGRSFKLSKYRCGVVSDGGVILGLVSDAMGDVTCRHHYVLSGDSNSVEGGARM